MIDRRAAHVFIRIFSAENISWKYVKVVKNRQTIYVRCLQDLVREKEHLHPQKYYWKFDPDYIFYNDIQNDIYNKVTADLLEKVIYQGTDAIIMAYGQTGSGKSLTITGIATNVYENRGILPRIISDLFKEIKGLKKNWKFCVQISYFETSRNEVRDLLKSCPNNVETLKEIRRIKVKTALEALKYMFLGEARKEITENSEYYSSHLASSVFTIYLSKKMANIDKSQSHLVETKLHVIDLAGADTFGNMTCDFKSVKGIGSANLAKTNLEQFIRILIKRIPEHIKVKQRIDFLIQHLGNSLSPSSALRFIGHIRTDFENIKLTLSVLRFGQMVHGFRMTKYDLDSIDIDEITTKLEPQCEELVEFTKLDDDLNIEIDEERYNHIKCIVMDYLDDKINELTLTNVVDIKAALDVIKNNYKQCQATKTALEIENAKIHSRTQIKRRSESSQSNSATQDRVERSSIKSENDLRRKHSSTISRKPSSIRSMLSLKTSKNGNGRKSSSKFDIAELMPDKVPEYNEAWKCYIIDRHPEFTKFLENCKANEQDRITAYKASLEQIAKLKQAFADVEAIEFNLKMAEMTKQYQNIEEIDENGAPYYTEIQIACMECHKQAIKKKIELQELVLRTQAELKFHIETCNDLKNDLRKNFEDYCNEKYKIPIEALGEDEEGFAERLIAIEEEGCQEKDVCIQASCKNMVIQKEEKTIKEKMQYDRLFELMYIERKKKMRCKIRTHKWSNCYK